jgi:hypothetical protein
MPVLHPNAEHAARTPFESRSNTAIAAIIACVYDAQSKIGSSLLRFSAPC